MKQLFLIGLLLWSSCSFYAGERDKDLVEKWLAEAVSLPMDSCRTLHFAKKMLDVPYVAGTLDGNEEEQLVVRTDALDCTTFVETSLSKGNVNKLTRCNVSYCFVTRDLCCACYCCINSYQNL